MKAANKRPDAFGSLLVALRAMYEAEVARLADHYRPRILAGEFSGYEDVRFPGTKYEARGDGIGGLRLERLEAALGNHPWLATKSARIAVVAVSRWVAAGHASAENGATEYELGDSGAECLANDIMAEAAARGWVKRYRERAEVPYALRVA